MGLSSATQRKPMMSVQNRCETSRFLTLRTIWLMPRGGWAWLTIAEASLSMVPSMIGERHGHCTAPGPKLHPGPEGGHAVRSSPGASVELELAAQRTGGRAEERRPLQAAEPLRPARHEDTAATSLDAHRGPSFLSVRRSDEPWSARRRSG